MGLRDDSDKVYSKLLYASPIYHYDRKPVYTAQELEVLKVDAEGKGQTDCMIHRLHDCYITVGTFTRLEQRSLVQLTKQ